MDCDLLDAARHVLETFHLGLAACVHHPGDSRDGLGEDVELFLQSCDQQNRYIRRLVDQLKECRGSELTDDCRIRFC